MPWGDSDDDEDALPARTESKVNDKGFKTVVEYHKNSAEQTIKTTKEIFVKVVETREALAVGPRGAKLRANRFGIAGTDENTNTTIVAHNDERITLEEEGGENDNQNNAAKASMNEFARKQQWRKLQQKYGVEGAAGSSMPTEGMSSDAPTRVPGMKASYVPPSMRGTAGAGVAGSALARMAAMPQYDDRDQSSLRVTNISEETTEADLQVLFAPYGRIARIYLAKDRETMISRGFAFVSFVHRQDAERAMGALQGHGYDHLILKIEWAKPSAPKPAEGGEGGGLSSGFTSGYGKALAQDTKERVSYASNLTGNR
jgi:translation initiation factor 3 subunit G